jgi:hypothetical protein
MGSSYLAASIASGPSSAENLCEHLVTEMLDGRHQEDDIALVVLVRLGAS